MRDASPNLGHDLTADEVNEIMNEHGVNHELEMTFEDFKAMILDHM